MIGYTKAYFMGSLLMLILITWSPNKYAYTGPLEPHPIDNRLVFNNTITELSLQLDSTLNRIRAKKDTIVEQTEELKKVVHKAKIYEPEISYMDSPPSDTELDYITLYTRMYQGN